MKRSNGDGPRGFKDRHIMVRLAAEGVPVLAISRAMRRAAPYVEDALEHAVRSGSLTAKPAREWADGNVGLLTRATRPPPTSGTLSADDVEEVNRLALQAHVLDPDLSQGPAIILAAIALWGFADRVSLMRLASGPGSDPKTIDVQMVRCRRVVRPLGITIDTVWGRGYSMKPACRDVLIAKINELGGKYDLAA